MQVKCEYCGNMISDGAATCPHCGAPNQNIKRTTSTTPKTIEELKQWYADRHLPPPETTRFFIGVDYKQPRAFGIYEQGGEYIVYKNKADGSRAVRYKGTDQAYAVNEIYLKLKSEILNQKSRQSSRADAGGSTGRSTGGRGSCVGGLVGIFFSIVFFFAAIFETNGRAGIHLLILVGVVLAVFVLRRVLNARAKKNGKKPSSFLGTGIGLYVIVIVLTCCILVGLNPRPKARYYRYNDTTYSDYDGYFYIYVDDFEDYEPVPYSELPADFTEHKADYEFDASHIAWVDDYEFTDSDYYEDNLAPKYSSSGGGYDNDSDWDWDWDSGGDWDFGDTDWDSDW